MHFCYHYLKQRVYLGAGLMQAQPRRPSFFTRITLELIVKQSSSHQSNVCTTRLQIIRVGPVCERNYKVRELKLYETKQYVCCVCLICHILAVRANLFVSVELILLKNSDKKICCCTNTSTLYVQILPGSTQLILRESF